MKLAAGRSCDGRRVAGQSAPPAGAAGQQAQQRRLAAPVRRASLSDWFASPFSARREAQYFRIRSATAWRCSAVIVRLRLPAALTAFCLPRWATGPALPSIASMARCMATSWLLERLLLVAQRVQDSARRHPCSAPPGRPAAASRRPPKRTTGRRRHRYRPAAPDSVAAGPACAG